MRTIVCRHAARWIVFLFGLVYPSLALSQAYTPTEQACYNNVQGKIALQTGQTHWPEAEARALCQGARAAAPRGECFKAKSPTLGVQAAIQQCSQLGQPAGSQPPSPQPEPTGTPSTPPALTPGATLRGVTIPGDDMTILPNTNMTANSCAASCNSNVGCVAWTLVRQGAQATSCHLKNAISREVFSKCCISGMAAERTATAPPPPPSTAPTPTATGSYTPTEQTCYSHVQGKIALQPGQTTWPEAQVRALCQGARAAAPRGECFKQKSPTLGVQAAIQQCSQLGQSAGSQPPAPPPPTTQAPNTPLSTTPRSTTPPPSAPSEAERACYADVQDNIAWNVQGQKHWPSSLLGGLCRNAHTPAGPGACFQKSMPHIGLRAAINTCAQKDGPVSPALMYTAQERACYSQVQGKIAVDKTGQKQWPEADARMLCDGARAAAPRALCYESRMPVIGGKASIEDCKLLGVVELPKLIAPPPPQAPPRQGTFVSPAKGGGTLVGVAPPPPAVMVPNQVSLLSGAVFEIDAKKGFACALLADRTSSDLTIWCEKFGTWIALNRSAVKISVDAAGNIWTVDKTGQVFEGTNNGTWLSPSWTWTQMLGPGSARDIATLYGSGAPYIVAPDGAILTYWPPPFNTVFWLCKQNPGVVSIRTASLDGWLQVKTTNEYSWLVLDQACTLGTTIKDSQLPAIYKAAAIDSDSSIWGIEGTGRLVHVVGGTVIPMSNINVGPAPTLVAQPVPPPPPPGANSYGIVQIPIRTYDFADWGYTAAEQTCNQMLQEQVDISKPPPPPQYDYNNRWSGEALSALCNNTHDPLATVTCFKNHVAADGWNAEKTLRGCATTPPPTTRHVNFTIYAPTTQGELPRLTPDQLDPAYVTTVPSPLSLNDLQTVLSWISSRVAAVHAPYCYKQTGQSSCPTAQPTSCGAGCAVSSSTCGSVTASQVLSPLLLAVNIATLASDTELKDALNAALISIKNDSSGADVALNEYLRTLDEAALAKDALDANTSFVTRAKNAIASRITNVANATEDFAGGKASFTAFKANATGAIGIVSIYQGGARLVVSYQGAYASNFAAMTSPDIDKAINQKFGPQGAKYIKMQYALYAFALSLQADSSGTAADILPIISFYDPTGIASVVQAYNHPTCDYGTPMPAVTPLYTK